jgi:hypothetical protein
VEGDGYVGGAGDALEVEEHGYVGGALGYASDVVLGTCWGCMGCVECVCGGCIHLMVTRFDW